MEYKEREERESNYTIEGRQSKLSTKMNLAMNAVAMNRLAASSPAQESMSASVVSTSSSTSQSVTYCKHCRLTVEKQIRYYKRSLADKEAALAKAHSLVKQKDRKIAMLNKKISQQEHTINEELRYIKEAAQRGFRGIRYPGPRPGGRNEQPQRHGLNFRDRDSGSSAITSNTDWTVPEETDENEEDDGDVTISPSAIYNISESDAKPPPPKPTLPTDDEDSDEDYDVFEDSAFDDATIVRKTSHQRSMVQGEQDSIESPTELLPPPPSSAHSSPHLSVSSRKTVRSMGMPDQESTSKIDQPPTKRTSPRTPRNKASLGMDKPESPTRLSEPAQVDLEEEKKEPEQEYAIPQLFKMPPQHQIQSFKDVTSKSSSPTPVFPPHQYQQQHQYQEQQQLQQQQQQQQQQHQDEVEDQEEEDRKPAAKKMQPTTYNQVFPRVVTVEPYFEDGPSRNAANAFPGEMSSIVTAEEDRKPPARPDGVFRRQRPTSPRSPPKSGYSYYDNNNNNNNTTKRGLGFDRKGYGNHVDLSPTDLHRETTESLFHYSREGAPNEPDLIGVAKQSPIARAKKGGYSPETVPGDWNPHDPPVLGRPMTPVGRTHRSSSPAAAASAMHANRAGATGVAAAPSFKREDSSVASHYHVMNMEVLDPYGDLGIYTGMMSTRTSMPDGFGSMRYTDASIGRTYEGTWQDGRWHGRGKLEHDNGDVYEGDFENDKRHGTGTYQQKSTGRVYIGEFFRDKRHGKGLLSCNTFQYDGEFCKGSQHGHGRMTFTKGGFYEGEFRDNNFCGNGQQSWPDGRFYQGEFAHNQREGQGIEIFGDGSVRHQGLWRNDQPVNIHPY